MIAAVVLVLGAAAVVAGVVGLAGPWWGAITAGVLLMWWAVLDQRGAELERPGSGEPERAPRGRGGGTSETTA